MKTGMYCPPCIYRTYMDALKHLDLTEEQMFAEGKWLCGEMASSLKEELPSACNHVYSDRLWTLAGGDCYREDKQADNRRMMDVAKEAALVVEQAENPLEMAVRYAIAGNVIDPTAHYDEPLEAVLSAAAARTLAVDDTALLKKALKRAERVLYVTDNAGEVVMDKLLIDTMLRLELVKPGNITVAVRSKAFANDALMEDAQLVGLTDVAHVIGTGSPYATLYPKFLSEEFLEEYRKADLLIAKGMGNFESVCEFTDKTTCSLLMTKCVPVAQKVGSELGAFVCQVRNAALLGL